MAVLGMVVLGGAVATSTFAAIVPWLQREEMFGLAWERKAAFALFLADAAYHWSAFANMTGESRDATWLATLTLLLLAGVVYAFYVMARGFTLPPLVRWSAAILLGLVEPALLIASFWAVHGPVPLY